MKELIKTSVYYKIFDKSYKDSSHIYKKKNQATDLESLEIEKNRKAIVDYFSADNIYLVNQVHGNKVIDADHSPSDLDGDGIVTSKKNLVLAIYTADCVPILLASNDRKIIGAAHCGWPSAKANIVDNLVHLMKEKGAKSIKAIIGPAIQQSSYEVDQIYYDDFIADDNQNSQFFIKGKRIGHFMFDLPSYVESKLQKADVHDIFKSSEDTYSNPEKYPSYRRACHLGEKYTQNILSAIMLK